MRETIREVAGQVKPRIIVADGHLLIGRFRLAPYERRVIELLRNSKDKRKLLPVSTSLASNTKFITGARKLAKKRVSYFQRHETTRITTYILYPAH